MLNMITEPHHTLTPTDTYGRFRLFISNKHFCWTDEENFTTDDFDKGIEADMARREHIFRRRTYEPEINRQFQESLHRNLLCYAEEERRMIEIEKNYQHRSTNNEKLLPYTKGTIGMNSRSDDSSDTNNDSGDSESND